VAFVGAHVEFAPERERPLRLTRALRRVLETFGTITLSRDRHETCLADPRTAVSDQQVAVATTSRLGTCVGRRQLPITFEERMMMHPWALPSHNRFFSGLTRRAAGADAR
jgi:hypothetical protein